MPNSKSPRVIQSVQRALDIINCFNSIHTQLSLTEISERLALHISTVHGLINTLCANGYMVKVASTGKYKLGLEFIMKANLVTQSLDLKEIGHPFLTQLTTKYNETFHLYIFQQEQIYCVDKVESPNNYFIISSRAGSKLPIHASASGKVFLTYMKEKERVNFLANYELFGLTNNTITILSELEQHFKLILERGYGIENEEIEDNAYSIAVPIFEAQGNIAATISIIGSKQSIREKEDAILADLLLAAQHISSHLGYVAPM